MPLFEILLASRLRAVASRCHACVLLYWREAAPTLASATRSWKRERCKVSDLLEDPRLLEPLKTKELWTTTSHSCCCCCCYLLLFAIFGAIFPAKRVGFRQAKAMIPCAGNPQSSGMSFSKHGSGQTLCYSNYILCLKTRSKPDPGANL